MKYYPGRESLGTVEAVDQTMITQWNRVVGYSDLVYVIGDIAMGGNVEKTMGIYQRLNGTKILVTGNHDNKMLRNPKFFELFKEVHLTYHERVINGQLIVMCHFPIWEWHQIHRNSWHLHGHLHGKPHGIPGKILDVSADGHDLTPWSFEDVKRYMDKRELRTHHT
jgi:calcineurin-like phosphoesterase family protein